MSDTINTNDAEVGDDTVVQEYTEKRLSGIHIGILYLLICQIIEERKTSDEPIMIDSYCGDIQNELSAKINHVREKDPTMPHFEEIDEILIDDLIRQHFLCDGKITGEQLAVVAITCDHILMAYRHENPESSVFNITHPDRTDIQLAEYDEEIRKVLLGCPFFKNGYTDDVLRCVSLITEYYDSIQTLEYTNNKKAYPASYAQRDNISLRDTIKLLKTMIHQNIINSTT